MSQDEYIRTALRVPPDLHKALHQAADAHGRSFNAEIIARLLATFEMNPRSSSEGNLIPRVRLYELMDALPAADFDALRARLAEAIVQISTEAVEQALRSSKQLQSLQDSSSGEIPRSRAKQAPRKKAKL